MVFSSASFLFAFLPIALIVYFAVPKRAFRNVWLLVISLVFYAWGEPVYVLLMIFSIVVNWGAAMLVEGLDGGAGSGGGGSSGSAGAADAASRTAARKAVLVLSIVFNIAVIGFFKYEGFLAANINGLIGFELIPNLNLPLPIGISFYTLQALSYVIDVYRHDVPAQRNPLYLGMYVACFPQLIAGPIVRYQVIQDQVLNRRETLEDFASGLRLFIVGLGKKVLLANTVAILATKMLTDGGASIGVVGAWAGLVAYTFQIFFDFSGYSDMAIGLGRMFGFKYLRNFNYPYISRSIGEFWRRWHISLYTFFRDYLYIPLGGSRVSTGRWVFNMAVVWTVTGVWHGAAWNYILWGVYYGIILAFEKLVWGRALAKLPVVVQHLYTIVLFMFGWLIFWITDLSQFGTYLAAMFGAYGLSGNVTVWETTAWQYWPVFVACIVASTPLVPWLKWRLTMWVEGKADVAGDATAPAAGAEVAPAAGAAAPAGKPRATSFAAFMATGIAHPKAIEADTLCVFTPQPIDERRARVAQLVATLADVALFIVFLLSVCSVLSGSFNPFIYFQF